MSSWKGYKSAAEGALTPVFAAMLPPDALSGRFYSECAEAGF